MPIVDKPIQELLQYQGNTPRPADFDEFWDARLTQLDGIDPKPELVESSFQTSYAECFDLYFTSTKGAKIHAKYARPRNSNAKCPAILFFHGYTGDSGDWLGYLPYVAEGFCIAAMDCRGQGGLSQDAGGTLGMTCSGQFIRGLDGPAEDMLFVQIYLDTALLARIVMKMDQVDETRVGVRGGSQGGGLTLACASLVPQIRKAAPDYPFLSDYKRVWDMDLAVGAYAELKTYFRAADPRHEQEQAIFEKLGYIDIQNLTKRIRAEVLMGVGLMDTVCPPSTQFAAYNKITSPKRYILYPDYGHEDLRGHKEIIFQFFQSLKD